MLNCLKKASIVLNMIFSFFHKQHFSSVKSIYQLIIIVFQEMELGIPPPGAHEPITLLNVLGPSVEKSRSVVDPLGIGVENKEYYTDKDLTIGSVLGSYGRRFVLVDMDKFTKEYYQQRYGLGKWCIKMYK